MKNKPGRHLIRSPPPSSSSSGFGPVNLAALLISGVALYRALAQEIRLEELDDRLSSLRLEIESGAAGAESGPRDKRSAGPPPGPSVEFVHPGFKGELAPFSGSATEWLTTYARVPVISKMEHN